MRGLVQGEKFRSQSKGEYRLCSWGQFSRMLFGTEEERRGMADASLWIDGLGVLCDAALVAVGIWGIKTAVRTLKAVEIGRAHV